MKIEISQLTKKNFIKTAPHEQERNGKNFLNSEQSQLQISEELPPQPAPLPGSGTDKESERASN